MSGGSDVVSVVHVVVAGEIGGAERMLVDLAAGRPGHCVALLTPSERLRAFLRDHGLDVVDRGPVRETPLAYLVRSIGPRDVTWLTEVVRRREARVVHLHTFGSQVLGTRAALRASARVVRTEHSTRVYDDLSCWPFSRWSLRRADVAVCISEHVRSVALAKAPWANGKLRVVPNGVDLERFAPVPLDEKIEEPASRGALRLVAVGRLEPRKGFDLALAAVADVPGVSLTIVGDGEERASLEALAARLGIASRVRFTGWLADVREPIAAAHLALSSARAEGLGIALIEAMAMGRAVVALPTGGVPELVRDGDTGWLAHGADAPALARAIRAALEAPAEIARRAERARRHVLGRFSVDAMRQGYDAVYADLRACTAGK